MPAPARAKSAEFASATLSVSVLRPPTHLAKAASVAAAFGSVLCGNPTQPLGRSVDRSTMPFSCGSNAGDGEAGLLVTLPWPWSRLTSCRTRRGQRRIRRRTREPDTCSLFRCRSDDCELTYSFGRHLARRRRGDRDRLVVPAHGRFGGHDLSLKGERL